ncbi:hypothetical protein Tco_0979722 [Tanacetum coccineum]
MISLNKPTSKPSRVAKMSVKPIWRKKLNPCNTSNGLNVNLPTQMPKPLTPHQPSQENNHPNQASPNPYIKNTTTSPQVMAPLPPREQRHPFLRYHGLEYTDEDIANFEERMRMEHRDDAGVVIFTSQAWGRLFGTRGPLVMELIMKFFSTLRFGEALGLNSGEEMESLEFARYWSERGLSLRGRVGLIFLKGKFIARLAEHFGLLTVEILGGLTIIAPELPIIDMAELVRLQICAQFDDTWAWVAMRPKRQPDAAVGAPAVAEDAPAADEGNQAVPALVQAP